MSYSIETYPSEPIVVASLHAGYDIGDPTYALSNDLMTTFDRLKTTHWLIIEFDQTIEIGMDVLMQSANRFAQDDRSILRHPNTKGMIIVAQNALVSLSAAGLGSKAFGNINLKVFDTLDEALAFVRSE